jgi:hypothetical protein
MRMLSGRTVVIIVLTRSIALLALTLHIFTLLLLSLGTAQPSFGTLDHLQCYFAPACTTLCLRHAFAHNLDVISREAIMDSNWLASATNYLCMSVASTLQPLTRTLWPGTDFRVRSRMPFRWPAPRSEHAGNSHTRTRKLCLRARDAALIHVPLFLLIFSQAHGH